MSNNNICEYRQLAGLNRRIKNELEVIKNLKWHQLAAISPGMARQTVELDLKGLLAAGPDTFLALDILYRIASEIEIIRHELTLSQQLDVNSGGDSERCWEEHPEEQRDERDYL